MSDRELQRTPAIKPTAYTIREGLPPRTASGRIRTYTFTHLWCRDVMLGKVSDHDKLIAHGVQLRIGTRTQLAGIPFRQLLINVQYELRKAMLASNGE